MTDPELVELIRKIVSTPTAPFHEKAVREELVAQLSQVPGVRLEQDDFGNLLAERGPAGRARYALTAHMDHPAYVFAAKEGPRTERPPGEGWTFLGGVPEAWREKLPDVEIFEGFGMWDLPAFALEGDRIHARVCDDLIGCAGIVAVFRELAAQGLDVPMQALFTRGEECGFIGAIHLARSGRVPAETIVISLECSSERSPGAGKMGEGVIIRVGDRTSIFDDRATAELAQAGEEEKIPYQRCLMSGGTCEATAWQAYGYRTAAVCVALGNYHNCGPDHVIAPEFVALSDVSSMVRLLTAAVLRTKSEQVRPSLRERLEKRFDEHRIYF